MILSAVISELNLCQKACVKETQKRSPLHYVTCETPLHFFIRFSFLSTSSGQRFTSLVSIDRLCCSCYILHILCVGKCSIKEGGAVFSVTFLPVVHHLKGGVLRVCHQ